jgi:hypothetical protein
MTMRDVAVYIMGALTGWALFTAAYCIVTGAYIFVLPLLLLALIAFLIYRSLRNEIQAWKWRKARSK